MDIEKLQYDDLEWLFSEHAIKQDHLLYLIMVLLFRLLRRFHRINIGLQNDDINLNLLDRQLSLQNRKLNREPFNEHSQ